MRLNIDKHRYFCELNNVHFNLKNALAFWGVLNVDKMLPLKVKREMISYYGW